MKAILKESALVGSLAQEMRAREDQSGPGNPCEAPAGVDDHVRLGPGVRSPDPSRSLSHFFFFFSSGGPGWVGGPSGGDGGGHVMQFTTLSSLGRPASAGDSVHCP